MRGKVSDMQMKLQSTSIRLPESIARLILDCLEERIMIGYSNASVYRFTGDGKDYYLKYMPPGMFTSISHEASVIGWLQRRLPVPRIIEYIEDENGEYLLMSKVEGKTAAEVDGFEPNELVALYAQALKMIHSIPIDDCPFLQSTDVKIKDCLYNLDHNLVKLEYLHDSRQGLDYEELRKILLSMPRSEDDLVFTHGDYCFPNVIINGRQVNGFIDFSIGG